MKSMSQSKRFYEAFRALTGNNPFSWQRRLYECFLHKKTLAIPTGLGKTSIIPIWLIALAESVEGERPHTILPTRLVYIVNRRTVVDQATSLVEQMRSRLVSPRRDDWREHASTLESLSQRLRHLSGRDDVPLAVSTLRGELADNEEWKTDPSRPAVMIGTVDMIGSKLLFSGYGDSFRLRPHHAGLIGHDTLIIHDEAHLTPAFGNLLRQVAEVQTKTAEPGPIRVVELSATPPNLRDRAVFTLEQEDENDEIVQRRFNASKSVRFHSVKSEDFVETTCRLACKYENSRSKVLLYVRSPEQAQQVVRELEKKLQNGEDGRVALLTGTLRGHERDSLLQVNTTYHSFLNHGSKVDQTRYLVSTSAGEVGIDLDADHMVCDLTTLDCMIQRIGRVNRSPDQRVSRDSEGGLRLHGLGGINGQSVSHAQIDVVIPEEDEQKKKQSELDNALDKTRQLLERLPTPDDGAYDASPRALQNLLLNISDEERREAFTPQPTAVPITDVVLDAWSLTSIRQSVPGRLEVASYLHGLTSDPPETYVVWRKEVCLLHKYDLDSQSLEDWFRACRIETREKLRERTDRVLRELKKIQSHHDGEPIPTVLLSETGDAELLLLSELINRRKEGGIAYRTVVLPVEAGGLTEQGTLDGDASQEASRDIAEYDGKRVRLILGYGDNQYRVQPLGDIAPNVDDANEQFDKENPCESARDAAEQVARKYNMVVSHVTVLHEPLDGEEAEGETILLLLLTQPEQQPFESREAAGKREQPTLEEHTAQVADQASRIAISLGLPDDLREALTIAAKWHDRGKNRPIWQRAIFNPGPEPLAKPGARGMNVRLLGGYRHEFGSLLEAAADPQVREHPECDLILHLIAAHHGRARPHFELDAFDVNYTMSANEHAAYEVMRRFAWLQQRFGHWGLAWLECLLRCADAAASEEKTKSILREA